MATAALNCRACNLRPTLILRSSSERGAISRSADTSKIAQEQQHHHHVVVTGSKCIETRQTRSVGPTTNERTDEQGQLILVKMMTEDGTDLVTRKEVTIFRPHVGENKFCKNRQEHIPNGVQGKFKKVPPSNNN